MRLMRPPEGKRKESRRIKKEPEGGVKELDAGRL